jgi:DNA repair ATPase RecN
MLANLSKKTQVLFMTHQARLVDLAKKEEFGGRPEIHFL